MAHVEYDPEFKCPMCRNVRELDCSPCGYCGSKRIPVRHTTHPKHEPPKWEYNQRSQIVPNVVYSLIRGRELIIECDDGTRCYTDAQSLAESLIREGWSNRPVPEGEPL